MTLLHIIGIVLTVGLLLLAGLLSGRRAGGDKKFTTGGSTAGKWMVCGAIMGTLVGGQTTIGTAQLAFTFGFSAMWFALGSSIGCVLLALAYAGPLRRSGCTTIMEIVGREYGRKTEVAGSVLSLVSIFVSILAQILSAAALIMSFFSVNFFVGCLIAAGLMLCYVLWGGAVGAGAGGLVKLMLLYASCVAGGVAVWCLAHGFTGLIEVIPSDIRHQYTYIFARGPLKDLGSALSISLGVLSTQTYAQGVWMAKSNGAAKRGTLLCALLIPPIGAASVLIGIYMRGHYVTADELQQLQAVGERLPDGMGVIGSSAQAFPRFVMDVLPDWFGGIVLGTLLVTVIGSGSGLSLGASTILVRDVLTVVNKRFAGAKAMMRVSRTAIAGILLLGVAVALVAGNGFINDLGFLSLGLRATTVLIPLSCALWMPKRFGYKQALASMIAASAMMLAAHILNLPGDAMFYGLAVGLAVVLLKF